MQDNQQPSFGYRICGKCGQVKRIDEFAIVYAKNSRGQNYRQHTCIECAKKTHAERMRKARKVDPEKYKLHQRKHRAAYLERCQRQKRESDTRRRYKVFIAYGGQSCKCCKETETTMLTVDHINNDGNKHRNEINGGKGREKSINIYTWLIKNNFPPDFQILCYNCNISKHRNKGFCAHQLKKGSETIP